MFTAPLETCLFILDNIKERGWEKWRETSGQGSKKALRERVERVRASSSNKEPSKGTSSRHRNNSRSREHTLTVPTGTTGAEPDQHVEEIETTASIMHTALRSANVSGQGRVDEAPGMVRFIDVVEFFYPSASSEYASQM